MGSRCFIFYVLPLELESFIVIFVASGEATNAPMFGRTLICTVRTAWPSMGWCCIYAAPIWTSLLPLQHNPIINKLLDIGYSCSSKCSVY